MNEKPFAFVLMPFDREGILERIYNQIDVADLIIADMTGRNPNVFYEVGYAHAKNKLCVLLTKTADDIPFDLKHHRHIVYSSVVDLRSKLKADLDSVKVDLAEREQPIRAELNKISGDLEASKHLAYAVVTIAIDMRNLTSNPSPEIDAIYFYTGSGWLFKQDQQDCTATSSDLAEFKLRHFLRAPVQRLGKNGWAPIKIVGRKLVGTSFKGEVLKDSYDLIGFSLFKVKTIKGDYDSRINLKVTADEIPF